MAWISPRQAALAWFLRREEVTSISIGASNLCRIEENVVATKEPKSTDEELSEIGIKSRRKCR